MIGSELPLAGGIVDYLETYDFKCFGPSKHIAKLEWDKSFCRYFLNKVNPSLNPNFWIFKEEKRLESFLKKYKQQVVVKPIGLTGGKGVRAVGIQLKDNNDALKYGKRILKKKIGGSPRVIIEERRYGKHQFSFLKSSNLIQNKLDAVIIIKNF